MSRVFERKVDACTESDTEHCGKVLDLSRAAPASRVGIPRRLTAVEGKDTGGVEEHEPLEAELCDANLKLEMMQDWKKTFADPDKKRAAAFP